MLAQRAAQLLGQETGFRIAEIAQHGVEAAPIELAGDALEIWILGDLACDLGIAQAEPKPRHPLVDDIFGDHLLQDLPVEPDRTRLIRQNRPSQVAAELLQAVLIGLPELLNADFAAPDLGDR